MERAISCEFNLDTACVELKFADGSMISIDTVAVENEVADNMYQRSELDWLIYNQPLEYANVLLFVIIRSISPVITIIICTAKFCAICTNLDAI